MDENIAQGCAVTVKTGRPSLYQDAYCDKVIELAKQGQFIYQIAHSLGVTTKTLYNWERDHEVFLHALTRAREIALAYWETFALSRLESRDFQAKLYEFIIRSKTEGMQASTVNLPEIKEATTYSHKCEVIIHAVADGRITVLQAQSLINIVSVAAKVEEVTDLKAKIKLIEDWIG